MKISTRRLLFNRYYLITFLLLIIVPYLSWYFFSGYFEASFIWDLSDMRGTREEYFQTVFSFQNFAIDSFSLIQMILPVFSGIVMLPFLRDQKLYPICYLRTKSYRRFVLSNIIKHVLAGCIVLYLAYCVLMLIGASILHPVVLYYERDLYMDILGRSFYSDSSHSLFAAGRFSQVYYFRLGLCAVFRGGFVLYAALVLMRFDSGCLLLWSRPALLRNRQHVQRGLILLLSGLHDCTGRTLLHQHHTSAGSAFAAASVFHCDVYLGTEPEKKAW